MREVVGCFRNEKYGDFRKQYSNMILCSVIKLLGFYFENVYDLFV